MTRCHQTEVEHRSHNPKVAGSNPAPATKRKTQSPPGFFCVFDFSEVPAIYRTRRVVNAVWLTGIRRIVCCYQEIGPSMADCYPIGKPTAGHQSWSRSRSGVNRMRFRVAELNPRALELTDSGSSRSRIRASVSTPRNPGTSESPQNPGVSWCGLLGRPESFGGDIRDGIPQHPAETIRLCRIDLSPHLGCGVSEILEPGANNDASR